MLKKEIEKVVDFPLKHTNNPYFVDIFVWFRNQINFEEISTELLERWLTDQQEPYTK